MGHSKKSTWSFKTTLVFSTIFRISFTWQELQLSTSLRETVCITKKKNINNKKEKEINCPTTVTYAPKIQTRIVCLSHYELSRASVFTINL